jgi:hypothetical protein
MIPEHADHRNLDRGDLAREGAGLVGVTVVGDIAADDEHIRRVVDLREHPMQRARSRRAAVMEIADRGDAHDILRPGHIPPLTRWSKTGAEDIAKP